MKDLLISHLTNQSHPQTNQKGKSLRTYIINGVQLLAPNKSEAEKYYLQLQQRKHL